MLMTIAALRAMEPPPRREETKSGIPEATAEMREGSVDREMRALPTLKEDGGAAAAAPFKDSRAYAARRGLTIGLAHAARGGPCSIAASMTCSIQ